jgi:hypothetical protein
LEDAIRIALDTVAAATTDVADVQVVALGATIVERIQAALG